MSVNHKTILIIAHLCVLCFGRDRTAYEYYAEIDGWLGLNTEPADWETATSNCQSENAVLASPWTAAFSSAINSLQSEDEQSLSVLYSGLHASRTLPSLNGEPAPWLGSSDLERCGVFYANGSSGEVDCGQRLPYVCFARVVAVPLLGCAEGRLGYKYQAPLQGWLKLHQQPADWQAARVRCHMEGAFLASPWSKEFSSAIHEIQSSEDGQVNEDTIPVLYSGVHILTTAKFSEGVYTNVKGEPAISMEPSELTRTERCGVFYANGTTGNVSCTEELPFVCYVPTSAREHAPTSTTTPAPTSTTTPAPISTTTPAPTPTCGNKSLGYELFHNESFDSIGNCYKFHVQAATWMDANKTCVKEGARLAVPNSEREEKILMELYERYPDDAIHGADDTGSAYVGIYKDSGVWWTVDDETLAQAGYTHWGGSGQPSRDNDFPYVVIHRNGAGGVFNEWYTYRKFSFICEMAPTTPRD